MELGLFEGRHALPPNASGSPRILILGALGMLGHKAVQVLGRSFETYATVRTLPGRFRGQPWLDESRLIEGVDALDTETIRRAIDAVRPNVVFNCVGIIKQLKEAKDARLSIEVNALLPYRLADLCARVGARLIHISTDCVFSGRRGAYTESDISDAEDLYGHTKYLGEVQEAGMLTLRTSIIGHGILPNASLVDWFLSQRGGSVRGFRRAIYSGLPTIVLCEEVARIIRDHPDLSGLYQVGASPITKYDLLLAIRERYGLTVTVEPSDDFVMDRSFLSDRYRQATGFSAPGWPALVERMYHDYREHSSYKARHDA